MCDDAVASRRVCVDKSFPQLALHFALNFLSAQDMNSGAPRSTCIGDGGLEGEQWRGCTVQCIRHNRQILKLCMGVLSYWSDSAASPSEALFTSDDASLLSTFCSDEGAALLSCCSSASAGGGGGVSSSF